MPNPIPPPLASYISACLTSSNAHSATILTSTLSAPSPWLTLRFIYAAIYGDGDDRISSAHGISRRTGQDFESSNNERPVIFISLLRPLALWVEIGKKLGLDIPSLVKTGRIVYVDGLTPYGNVDSINSGTENPVGKSSFRLKSLGLEEIEYTFEDAVRRLSNPISAPSTVGSRTPARINTASARVPATSTSSLPAGRMPVVVVDGIDFILACQQPSISVLSLQSTLATLRTKSQSLIVTCSADGPLLHNHDGVSTSTTPLEADHALFVTSMAHQCQWLFQLRGLDTGTAEDVSGVVRVSRGGAEGGDEREEDLVDAEWLYQIKGDGSVRVWGRGE